MSDKNRKTRRQVQAELRAQGKSKGDGVNNNHHHGNNSAPQIKSSKKSILAILFLIEAVVTIFLYKFLGLTIGLVLGLIPFIYFLLTSKNQKMGKKRPKASIFIFILYLIIILIGIRTNSVLGSLVSGSQSNQFYVMAMKDDEVDSLDQITDTATMGLGQETSYNTNVFPKAKFEEQGYSFSYSNYESDTDSANALLAGEIRFIVVNNPKEKELKKVDGFGKKTKVIANFKENIKIKSGNKNVKKQTFTVLLTGVDTRSDAIDGNARSDSIMVAKVNPKTLESAIVSIPRDAYIQSSCTGEYDKITHSSLNGMNCLIDDVQNLLDVDIDYYLKVNFFAVIDAIDAVGGVDVNVEQSFCGQDEYDNLNAYCFDAGEQHLSGSEALSFARERHAFGSGDYARAEHQQAVISGFLKSLMKSGPFAISKLLDVASASARTNLSANQLTDLAKLLQKSSDFTIDSYTLQGYGMRADLPYWGLYGTSVQNIEDSSIATAKDKLAVIS